MPRYEVRLEAQDGSGHFRVTKGDFPDAAEARKHCERMEMQRVLYRMPAEQAVALCEQHGIKVKTTGEGGEIRPLDVTVALDRFPKPARRDASASAKAPFRALTAQERARLHTHFQEEPYKVVSAKEVK